MQIPKLCLCAATLFATAASVSSQELWQGRSGVADRGSLIAATAEPSGGGAVLRIREGRAGGRRIHRMTDGEGLLRVLPGPAWTSRTLGATDGGRVLRRFGAHLYVVHSGAGTITRLPVAGGLPEVFDLGATSDPQDVLLPDPQDPSRAFVTRRDDPWLLRFDLTTGQSAEVLDLDPLGGGDAIALGTMARDGDLLFVQVRVFTANDAPVPGDEDIGVLGVVDLGSLSLVDVDPVTAGIQGIALQGAPPRFEMQILGRTLYVSTTDGTLDSRGGIEMVDLDLWQSVGYALSEQQIGDLGGFVMTSPAEGFFVFHTDLLPSTHLEHFTVARGPDPGPEMIVLLGAEEDVIAYDARTEAVYLPSGDTEGAPAIHVFDARTKRAVEGGAIATGMRPYDVLVGR